MLLSHRVHQVRTAHLTVQRGSGWELGEISCYSLNARTSVALHSSGIGAIRKAKEFVDWNTLALIYNALVQPHFDYCCEIWDVLGETLSDRLQKLQNRAARIIMNYKNESGQSLLARNALGWINLEERRAQMKARLMYKSINNLASERLSNLFQNSSTIYDYDLRGSSTRLCLAKPKTEFLKKSFSYNGAYVWNHIPEEIRNSELYNSFCQKLSSSTISFTSPLSNN